METQSQAVQVGRSDPACNQSNGCGHGDRFHVVLEQLSEEHNKEVFRLNSRVKILEKLIENSIPQPSHLPPQLPLPGTADCTSLDGDLWAATAHVGLVAGSQEPSGAVVPPQDLGSRLECQLRRTSTQKIIFVGDDCGSPNSNYLPCVDAGPELVPGGANPPDTLTKNQIKGGWTPRSSESAYVPRCTLKEEPSESEFVLPYTLKEESSETTFVPTYTLKEEWLQKPDLGMTEDVDIAEVRKFADSMQAQCWTPSTSTAWERQCSPKSTYQKMSGFTYCPPLSPTSHTRITWDLAGFLFLIWDLIWIPVGIAFTPDENCCFNSVGWVIVFYWTLDMLASCNTGFFQDGRLELRRKKILRNYLQHWFWIDLAVVVPDYVMRIMGTTNASSLGRVVRVARFVRVVRLIRLLKLKKLFDLLHDLIDNEYMFLVFNTVKPSLIILIMNHMVACAWYLIGKLGKEHGASRNWLQDVGMTPVDGTDFWWKYWTSFHWSITQFTPASMDISATNTADRVFSVLILFWALVTLSSFIGSVTASMTAIRNLTNEEMTQFWLLRRYLKQKAISKDLTERLVRYLEFRTVSKHNQIDIHKVTLLGYLTEQLNIELANEMNGPILRNHPFFDQLAELFPVMHCRLCWTTLTRHSLAHRDLMFELGADAEEMYFIVTGDFEYKLADGQSLPTPIGANSWAGEAVLWVVTWRHKGYLVALGPCETVGVNPASFVKVIQHHPRCFMAAQYYGSTFVKYINGVRKNAVTDVMFDPLLFGSFADALPSDPSMLSKTHSFETIFHHRFVCPQASRLSRNTSNIEATPKRDLWSTIRTWSSE